MNRFRIENVRILIFLQTTFLYKIVFRLLAILTMKTSKNRFLRGFLTPKLSSNHLNSLKIEGCHFVHINTILRNFIKISSPISQIQKISIVQQLAVSLQVA